MGGFLAVAVVVAVVTFGGPGGPGATSTEPLKLERISVGSGAEAADVVRPEGLEGPAPGIIFMHGWGELGGEVYRPWIEHLARQGNVVIVPRYQLSEADSPYGALDAALAGIRAAVDVAPVAPGSLVVAGHSAGAALAADYAAVAAEDDSLPRPVAVYAAFPGRTILGYPEGIPPRDLAAIPPSTRIVALAANADKVVGEEPATELLDAAVGVPPNRKRFIEVTDRAVNGHYAPLRDDRAARDEFWDPLDELIAASR